MKIKYDNKVLLAIENGLKDGALNFAIQLAPYDRYTTKKERDGYHFAFKLASNARYFSVFKENDKRHCLLEYAIKSKDIIPIGWKITKLIDNIFIEETN